MDFKTIDFKKNTLTAHLKLNRKPKNEMDGLFFEELEHLVTRVLPNRGLKGLIVHGSGRHFSSGTDMAILESQIFKPNSSATTGFFFQNPELFQKINALPFPVVAAIQGCCIGSGMEMALACHYRIAGENAFFSLPESQFGLMPGCGGTVRLSKLIGKATAMKLILSGKPLLADEALEIGLVDLVTPKKKVLPTAEKLIKQLQQGSHF
jgi:enoyl-CoA hydratase/carnithine racemase